jgi:hypothetical protein
MNVITSDDSSASWKSIVGFISICLALTSSVLFAALCSWQWAASRIGPYWSQLTDHMIIQWRRSPTSRKFSRRVDQNANFYHSSSYIGRQNFSKCYRWSFRFDGPNRQLFGWSIKTVKGVGEWRRWKAIWWAQTGEKEEVFFFWLVQRQNIGRCCIYIGFPTIKHPFFQWRWKAWWFVFFFGLWSSFAFVWSYFPIWQRLLDVQH